MKPTPVVLVLASLLILCGCSTPDSRIASHRAAFDKFPSEVQQKISAGEVEVGFTEEMGRMALGDPDRQFSRKSANDEVEVWGYHDRRPQFTFGVGLGGGGRHSAFGVGTEITTGGYDPEEKIRVEFRDGHVVAVDHVKG